MDSWCNSQLATCSYLQLPISWICLKRCTWQLANFSQLQLPICRFFFLKGVLNSQLPEKKQQDVTVYIKKTMPQNFDWEHGFFFMYTKTTHRFCSGSQLPSTHFPKNCRNRQFQVAEGSQLPSTHFRKIAKKMQLKVAEVATYQQRQQIISHSNR